MSTKAIPVAQYDLEGRLVKVHRSVTSAARELGVKPSNIRVVIGDPTKQSYGNRWMLVDENLPDKLAPVAQAPDTRGKTLPHTSRPVAIYDRNGTLLSTYPSLSEAGRAHNVITSCLYRCLNNPSQSHHGLYVRRLEVGETASDTIVIPRQRREIKWEMARQRNAETKKTKAELRVVEEIDENGNVVREYASQVDAAKQLGVSRQMVNQGITLPCRVQGRMLRMKYPKS